MKKLLLILLFIPLIINSQNSQPSESLKKNILELLSKDKKASDIYQKDYDNWSFNYYKNIKSKSLRNQNINNIKYYEPKLEDLYNLKISISNSLNKILKNEKILSYEELSSSKKIMDDFYYSWHKAQVKSFELMFELNTILNSCDFTHKSKSTTDPKIFEITFETQDCLDDYNGIISKFLNGIENENLLKQRFQKNFANIFKNL